MAAPEPTEEEELEELRRGLTVSLGNIVGILGELVGQIVHMAPDHRDALRYLHERLTTALDDSRTPVAQLRELATLDAGARAALAMGPEVLSNLHKLGAQVTASSLLLEALTCHAPAEALPLLLAESPHRLAERALLTGLLAYESAQGSTAPQIASFVDLFIPFLEDNRESLARTGLPRRHFDACPWLDVMHRSTPRTRRGG
jgi:hypothetical protein